MNALLLTVCEVRAYQRVGDELAEVRFTLSRAQRELVQRARQHPLYLWAKEHDFPALTLEHNGWCWEVDSTPSAWLLAALVLPEPLRAQLMGYNTTAA
ncbi:MAG: hypothetical protein N2045_13950 [Fimbriimonadales bacterium]|nr:hypothetical protein [Fimbriimonadales bacterium]